MTKKKLFSVLAGLALLSGSQAFAWVGGPFDGGDYSATLDNEGVYQASLRYKNGSGYAQWANNVDLGPSVASGATGGGGSTTTSNSTVGSYLNRSVLYYKGIAFFGTASGMVDMDRREVTCVTNSQSEVTLSDQASTNTQGSFFLFGSSNTVNSSTSVVNNGGRGFVANTNFVAKITKTYPELRFSGTGKITLISPDAQPIISGLAQQIAESLSDIQAGDDGTVDFGALFDFLSDPDFLAAITPKNIDQVQENAETYKMNVYGNRRFFLGSR
ncbi:hypothetical protein [Verrucomicrobium sp. BvORR106]|uniref:hypothetical protein n=1 Tax=Verrucomicrobium sp. BvORR106 TaxID=1403819 RepID=UPI00056EE95B|nr:hypothetical protein [Verrucomicrobium sp. BvORR106]